MNELDRMRREAVTRLCQAQAEGRLSAEAFEERYALVREAANASMVQAIVADLADEDVGAGEVGLAEAPSGDHAAVPAAARLRLPAVLGSTHRAGPWTVPEEIDVLGVLGSVTLDFRDAAFIGDTVIIDASLTLASLRLIVPPGTQVENECRQVLSSAKHAKVRRQHQADPTGLLVVVQGQLVLSELEIKVRPPTGTEPTMLERMGLA
jgi:hypothetical protein